MTPIATWSSSNGKHTFELFRQGDRHYSWSEKRNGRECDHGAMESHSPDHLTFLATDDAAIMWFKRHPLVKDIVAE